MAEKKVLVVLGYGCHLSPPMKEYLDSVVTFVAGHPVSAIVTTGGYTNRKSAPGLSEAGMMADYLKACGVIVPILIEDRAVTTNQNIRNVAKILAEKYQPAHLTIFCDDAHSLKIKIVARFAFGRWPQVLTYELATGWVSKFKQIFIAMPLNVLAYLFPTLERLELARKERIMNNS